jgi:7,8-dihydro-6-hydroxymethylpterin-pyrophosphokinase
MNLKKAIQATEITEDTEMKRVSPIFSVPPMGEANAYGNPFFLCELCVLCG